jgi:phosphoenolpyruvate synthase/pyruvate phosphate dikinase
VRSSALSEDSAQASFAGQFETVLEVQGAAAIRAAVERCIASAAGARAESYRAEMGVVGGPEMAVLVQRMVTAPGVARAILEHLHLPSTGPPQAPARAPPPEEFAGWA